MKKILFFLILIPSIVISQETINVGSSPNDGTGDKLRNALIKVNNNTIYFDNFLNNLNNNKADQNALEDSSANLRAYIDSVGGNTSLDTTILSTSNFNLYNEADPTKKISFSNAGQSTGTTSTITVTDDINITDPASVLNRTSSSSVTLDMDGNDFEILNGNSFTLKSSNSSNNNNMYISPDNTRNVINGGEKFTIYKDSIISYKPLRYSGVTISNANDLANKGYVDNKYIFTTKTFASPLNVDFSTAVNQRCVITGTTTVNVSNIPQGTSILILKQNATGYAITIGTGWGTLRGIGTLKTTANAINVIQFIYDGTDTLYSILP